MNALHTHLKSRYDLVCNRMVHVGSCYGFDVSKGENNDDDDIFADPPPSKYAEPSRSNANAPRNFNSPSPIEDMRLVTFKSQNSEALGLSMSESQSFNGGNVLLSSQSHNDKKVFTFNCILKSTVKFIVVSLYQNRSIHTSGVQLVQHVNPACRLTRRLGESLAIIDCYHFITCVNYHVY